MLEKPAITLNSFGPTSLVRSRQLFLTGLADTVTRKMVMFARARWGLESAGDQAELNL